MVVSAENSYEIILVTYLVLLFVTLNCAVKNSSFSLFAWAANVVLVSFAHYDLCLQSKSFCHSAFFNAPFLHLALLL